MPKAKSTTSATRAPELPSTMKAAAVDNFGPPEALTLHELPVPRPDPDEILIALTAAGGGVWDADIRSGSGRPPGRVRFPLIPGTDGAGTVAAKGSRVRRFKVGERVYAYEFGNRKGGFYAEYVCVHAEHAGTVPTSLPPWAAAAAATTGLTALQGIDNVLRVKAGETVLIFGASGAVGTLAVQFAKRLGARGVARVVEAPLVRKTATLVSELVADAVIDARSTRAIEQIRKTAPDGLD